MKNATLIAIISLSVVILLDLIQFILSFFEIYSIGMYRIFGVLNFLGFVGILQFFVKLYNKQKE